jgi:hypothetical protein
MAKLLITKAIFVKLQRGIDGDPVRRTRLELPMFSLLSGALLPINAPVTSSIFDEFQAASPPPNPS